MANPRSARCRHALLVLTLALAGCATGPRFDLSAVDPAVTPATAVTDIAAARKRVVHWGGMIISGKNLTDHTQLEVLAYPLDHWKRPDRGAAPLGRFLVIHAGYLETVDYAAGRLVSVVGPITGTVEMSVGESPHTYPVVRADQLYLWPKAGARDTQLHFGVGVLFSR